MSNHLILLLVLNGVLATLGGMVYFGFYFRNTSLGRLVHWAKYENKKTWGEAFRFARSCSIDHANRKITVGRSLNLGASPATCLPPGVSLVKGDLVCPPGITELPMGLIVEGHAWCDKSLLTRTPDGFRVYGNFYGRAETLTTIGPGFSVDGDAHLGPNTREILRHASVGRNLYTHEPARLVAMALKRDRRVRGKVYLVAETGEESLQEPTEKEATN